MDVGVHPRPLDEIVDLVADGNVVPLRLAATSISRRSRTDGIGGDARERADARRLADVA